MGSLPSTPVDCGYHPLPPHPDPPHLTHCEWVKQAPALSPLLWGIPCSLPPPPILGCGLLALAAPPLMSLLRQPSYLCLHIHICPSFLLNCRIFWRGHWSISSSNIQSQAKQQPASRQRGEASKQGDCCSNGMLLASRVSGLLQQPA